MLTPGIIERLVLNRSGHKRVPRRLASLLNTSQKETKATKDQARNDAEEFCLTPAPQRCSALALTHEAGNLMVTGFFEGSGKNFFAKII